MTFLFFVLITYAQEDTLWSILGMGTKKSETEIQPPTTAELLSIFDSKKLSIPISYEDSVVEWIDKWKGSHNRGFRNWFQEAGKYDALITGQLRKNNIPTDLFFLAMIESGFDSNAVSSAQAVGIWQFIPATGKAYGLRIDGVIDERRDPVRSTEAAIEHLKDLKLELGYWHIAMAAYNAGTGLIQDAIIRHNTANYWYLSEQEALPQETREYVPKILAAAILSKDPQLFGVSLPTPKTPIELTVVSFTATKSTSLTTLAEYAGVELEVFQNWNPHILSSYIPRSTEEIRVYLSPSARTRFVQQTMQNKSKDDGYNARLSDEELALQNPPTLDLSVHAQKHIVQEGETLQAIAQKYGLTQRDIIKWNDLDDLEVKTGTVLSLLPPAPKKWTKHTVQRLETLLSIAEKYGCKKEEIMKWNALEEERVPTGTILFIKEPQSK